MLLVVIIQYIVSKDESGIDNRYQDIIHYLTQSPWRKKEIIVLTAEKSNISKRTAHDRLQDLEDQGVIESIEISRNRVFVKPLTDNKLTFDFGVENKPEVQSLLEEINQLARDITQDTFPSRSKHETTSKYNLLPNLTSLIDRFKNNTFPPRELKELEDKVRELDKICREKFLVIHKDPYFSYLFQIFDHLIFLLMNYDEIDNANISSNLLTLTTDLTETSQMYMNFLNNISLNAQLVGYEEIYESRFSERICELQHILKTGPDFIRNDIYYFIQSHGDTSQRIEAFVSNIKNQDEENYNELLTDIRSLYSEEEREKLRTRLRTIADELNGQQRSIVERLCVDLKHYNRNIQTDIRIKYYNQTKRKIIAILSHNPEKLENIERYSTESKPNVSSNIDSLSDDGYVDKVEGRRGYYRLTQEMQKSFEKKREKTPEPDREELKKILERMADRREEHVYAEGFPVYDDEHEALQRIQQPPWLRLHGFVLDYSFVLKREGDLSLFFEILDGDIEEIQKADRHYLRVPTEIVVILHIAELLHMQWYRGLENVRYHSELSKRLDELKQAHNCAPPDERKHIRSLISAIDFDQADNLFKQAIADNKENVDNLKKSVNDIYYDNNQMHRIVEYLSADNKDNFVGREKIRKELLEYSINIPYRYQF